MPTKAELYAQMADKVATQLTGSWQEWAGFLTTASRLYKYPFHEQLMIYAQRPDATACAEYDLWNEKMGRYVRRGSKGIALVDDSGDRPRLRYVFDISDTGTREHSRTPWMWQLEERHLDSVQAMLERTYDVSGDDLAGQLTEVAGKLAEEYWTEHQQDFFYIVDGSFLEEYDEYIWSSVSLEYDQKFRNFWGSTKAVRQLSDTICIENGLSIVENPKPHGKSYNKWLGDQAKPSHRELLRVAIDNALSQSPANFEELLKLLQESDCEVSKRGKSYRLKLLGWEKAARMDSLGEGYGLEDLQAVLSGKKAHTPRKKVVAQAEPPKVNLLVDIQAKLQAGKGAGYARWAKVFNLKQMAQTMNYLSENNLLEYAVLEEKAAAATAHHNELSAQIKAAEKRMAEIAVLRTHIVNYAKTREVYVAYRKAGYSKKFREEHEEEILLHQAAKNAFDEMGVKKLPKVKELQTEYAKLLEEKKKTYAEYRRSREEMRELLTAKANVDRVLKMEVEQDVEKEKNHGQR
ncbi:hypothetical protein F260042K2_04000 [Flavonifractor plautii]